jgi:hypothetical protein
MSFDEVFVLQDVLHERANLLAALDTLILRQDTMTFAGKLIERIAHQTTSWVQAADSQRMSAGIQAQQIVPG